MARENTLRLQTASQRQFLTLGCMDHSQGLDRLQEQALPNTRTNQPKIPQGSHYRDWQDVWGRSHLEVFSCLSGIRWHGWVRQT